MSCRVTTIDSTAPSPERMGVGVEQQGGRSRPSGTLMTTSSGPQRIAGAQNPGHRKVPQGDLPTVCAPEGPNTSRRSSGDCPGLRRLSTSLIASRLKDFGAPVPASKDDHTPTGEVSMRVSRSALARRSSRCRRALAINHRRLGGEHDQRVLVLLGELPPLLILGEVDAADALAQVQHGGGQEGHPSRSSPPGDAAREASDLMSSSRSGTRRAP